MDHGMQNKVEMDQIRRRVNGSSYEMVLRIFALLLTLAAAMVIGLDKQTKVVPIKLLPNLPPMKVPVTAKWRNDSAFIYLLVANVIACSYAAVSLILSIANKGGKRGGLVLMIIVLDQLVAALLSSSTGAAAAIGYLAYNGNSHVQWQKVCHVFDKFCSQAAASIALSLFGSLAFLLLVTFAALKPHKNG